MVYLFLFGLLVTLIFSVLEYVFSDNKRKKACIAIVRYFKIPLFLLLLIIAVGNNVNIKLNSAGYDSYNKCTYMRSYEIEDAYSYLKLLSNNNEDKADITQEDMYKAILTSPSSYQDNYIIYKISKIQAWESQLKEVEPRYYNYKIINTIIWGVSN